MAGELILAILACVYLTGVAICACVQARGDAIKAGRPRVTTDDLITNTAWTWWWPALAVVLAVGFPIYYAIVGTGKVMLMIVNAKPLPGAIEQQIADERKKMKELQLSIKHLERQLEVPQEVLNAQAWEKESRRN